MERNKQLPSDERMFQKLKSLGALCEGHFVYTSRKHGSKYINKDAAYPHPFAMNAFCEHIAIQFSGLVSGLELDSKDHGIQVVAAPVIGGVVLAQLIAFHLSRRSAGREVFAVYAEREERLIAKPMIFGPTSMKLSYSYVGDGCGAVNIPDNNIEISPGDELVLKLNSFVFKRGFGKFLEGGKKVLIVEDILTTGGTAKKVVEAARKSGGEVIGVSALCNRGGVTKEAIGDVPELFSLTNVQMDAFPEDECPLCKNEIPVNTEIGHGKEFLSRSEQK